MKILKTEIIALFILSIFILISSFALLKSGFFRTIDDTTTVRIMYLEKEIVRGDIQNIPVRWSAELSNNYGYPIYMFYAPLSYYGGAILMLLGFHQIIATKYVYIFPLIVGPFLFYLAARQKASWIPALSGSILFTLFPFRGFDTYIKGGAGEAWAIGFIPGVFLGIFLLEKNKRIGIPIVALFIFLTIISHQLVGYLLLILVVIYGLIFIRKNKDFWLSFFLGLGLSAFYLIPLVKYLPLIKVRDLSENRTGILSSLVSIKSILLTHIDLDPVRRFSSNILFFIFSGAFIFSIFIFLKQKTASNKQILFFGVISFISLFLISDLSYFAWKIVLPVTGFLQFSWRLFAILAFTLSIFLVLVLDSLKNKKQKYIFSIGIIFISILFIPFFKPVEYTTFYEYRVEGECATTTWQNEYLPKWVKDCPNLDEEIRLTDKNGKLTKISSNLLTVSAISEVNKKSELIINKYYFPGWNVEVNGDNSQINYTFSNSGIMKVNLPEGKSDIRIYFSKTNTMLISDLISIISIIFLIFITCKIIFLEHKKNK